MYKSTDLADSIWIPLSGLQWGGIATTCRVEAGVYNPLASSVINPYSAGIDATFPTWSSTFVNNTGYYSFLESC